MTAVSGPPPATAVQQRRIAHLSLGGNMGDRLARLAAALPALSAAGVEVLRASPVYQTAPMYVEDQPAFLNMALTVAAPMDAPALLAAAQAVERAAGRDRRPGERNGPRPLDIDIVLFDDQTLNAPDLVIPHPRLAERAFVLAPLADIAGDVVPPGAGASIDALLAQAPGRREVVRFAPPPPIGGPSDQPGGRPDGDETYTILLRDFRAPRPGGGDIVMDLDLTARHPGRRFPDDISAVMSYEDVVVGLRRLCARAGADANAAGLALGAVDLCLGFPRVLAARAQARIIAPGQTADSAECRLSHR